MLIFIRVIKALYPLLNILEVTFISLIIYFICLTILLYFTVLYSISLNVN